MPISKSLAKVKENTKGKDVHPKGRRFKQLNRASLRTDKLIKEQGQRKNHKEGSLVRVRFFKNAVEMENTKDRESFSAEEVKEMIQVFISNDVDALEDEKKLRRKGRPKSSKQDQLEAKVNRLKTEYKNGFLVPILTDSDIVRNVRNWKGDAGGMTNLRFGRIDEKGTEITADGDNIM